VLGKEEVDKNKILEAKGLLPHFMKMDVKILNSRLCMGNKFTNSGILKGNLYAGSLKKIGEGLIGSETPYWGLIISERPLVLHEKENVILLKVSRRFRQLCFAKREYPELNEL